MSILQKNIDYFGGDSLAAKVVVEKYLLQDNDGNYIEDTYDDVCHRIANEIVRIDENYPGSHLERDEILELLRQRIIVPHGSLLFGVGNNNAMTTISNCFVVPSPKDSISGIMDSAKMMANLYKARGGVGIDISSLRPDKTPVRNSARQSTGAWSFAQLYSAVTGSIGQCIAEGSWVLSKRGLRTIENIVPGDEVWTKEGWIRVKNVFKNGEKKIKKLTIIGGLSLRASEDHILSSYAPDPNNISQAGGTVFEKRLGELEENSWVNIIPGNLEWTSDYHRYFTPLEMTNCDEAPYDVEAALAYYHGFFFSASSKKSLRCKNGVYELYFNAKNEAEVKPFRNFLRRVFGIVKHVTNGRTKWSFKVHEPIFIDWLKHIGAIREDDSQPPVFPSDFLQQNHDLQRHFIAGFMQTQGFQGIRPKTKKSMTSFLREPLETIQLALFAMGVYSQISYNGFHNGWELTIIGAQSLDNFYKMYSRARWRPNFFMKKNRTPMKNDSVVTPYSVNVNKKIVNPVSWRFWYKFKYRTHPYPILRRRVEKIVDDGVAMTYDLELESEHWFWCNGFYVHNSGRRGALMITMDVRHPDIEKFIECKLDKKQVTNANISVKFNDEFMKAVESDSEFTLQWPVDSLEPKVTKVVKARDIWVKFLKANHSSSEPGALFWDRMANYTPNSSYQEFKPVCVNPCAEVGMGPFSNCRLVSLNLLPFVREPFGDNAKFDYEEFERVVGLATQFIDNIVDVDIEKMKNIQDLSDDDDVKELWGKFIDKTQRGREVGLGTMGIADVLACLQLRYGSDEGVAETKKIYSTLAKAAYRKSKELAGVRGPFPECDLRVKPDEFLIANGLKDCLVRRNISLLTCAPTGSIAIVAQVSSGIEPVFKNEYTRRKKVAEPTDKTFVGSDGQHYEEYTVVHHNVQRFRDLFPGKELPYYFVDAHAVLPEEKIKTQAAAQIAIDHSISNTANVPADVSLERLESLYISSWKGGLKGVTVYVDGSRDGILVTKTPAAAPEPPKKRPERLPCEIHHTTIKGEKWVVFVGLNNGLPYEVFCGLQEYMELSPKIKTGTIVKRKTKKSERGFYDLVVFEGTENEFVVNDIVNAFKNDEHMVMGRLVSLSLRNSGKVSYVAEQLFKDNSSDFMTYNKVLGRILKKYIKDGEKPETGSVCGECGGELTYREGCLICMNCGFSKCS